MDEHSTSTGDDSGASGSNGLLDTSKADRAVWLMKCPDIVSRFLQSSEDDSGRVAKVVLSVDPLRPDDSPEFTMELASSELGNVPKRYVMDMSKDFIPMSVFSESDQGKVSAEGKIQNKFDMRPHCEAIDSYGRLCRERTNKSMTKSRQIQLIDNDNGTYVRPMTRTAAGMDKKKVQVKVSEIRRTRGDREEIVDTMFKLFERQTHWTSRQLIQETDQPEQFLKEILRDICVYVTKGANQGTYVLKPEYQASGEEPSSSSSQEVDSPFIGDS